jgi:hypothetical protein
MKQILKVVTTLIVLAMGITYLGTFQNFDYDISVRPFIYRQLVPTLAWPIQTLFRSNYATAISIVILMATLLMIVSLRYFHDSFLLPQGVQTETYVLLTSSLVFLLAIYPSHTYDIPTVALFTLSIAFIVNKKILAFVLLFPIVCLNRETAFLLVIFFLAYTWHKLPHRLVILVSGICMLVYIGLKIGIQAIFEGYPGVNMMFNLWTNLNSMVWHPYILISTAIIFLAILSLVRAKWDHLPQALQVIMITILPFQVLLYFVLGVNTEMRVFLEFLPAVVLIGVINAPTVAFQTIPQG